MAALASERNVTALVDAVAFAIGEVIAEREIARSPKLDGLNFIKRASVKHNMAQSMAGHLRDEALAAIRAIDQFKGESDALV